MSVSVGSDAFTPVAELLIGQANKIGSFGLSLNKGKSAAISFMLNPSIGKEAYTLKVSSKKLTSRQVLVQGPSMQCKH